MFIKIRPRNRNVCQEEDRQETKSGVNVKKLFTVVNFEFL
jgi:hypothetical protein